MARVEEQQPPVGAPAREEGVIRAAPAQVQALQDKSADIQDRLSEERTFLAWFRTAVTLFSLGALISQLGIAKKGPAPGIVVIGIGTFCLLYGMFAYTAANKLMAGGRFQPTVWGILLLVLAMTAGTVAVVILSLV